MQTQTRYAILFATLIGAALLAIGMATGFTGDLGDSITHYLYSRYAFRYPVVFFDHWAKPLFVLLSAPFAQGGFIGIQAFNILCAICTALCTYFIAKKLTLKFPLMVFLFLFGAPMYFTMTLSGLTEYLFALSLSVILLLHVNGRDRAAFLLASLLPFARSEGLLLLPVFAVYAFHLKKVRLLPFLLAGHVVYAIFGAIWHKDLLWVFTHIPYASTGSPYGNGEITDMIFRLNYVIEKPIYLLLAAGFISVAAALFRQKKIDGRWHLLIAGSFVTFFAGHTLFWALGIFNSMGLPRVFIAVMPVIALLALKGFNELLTLAGSIRVQWILVITMTLLVALFPFTPRSQGIVINRDFFVQPEKKLIDSAVVPFICAKFPDYSSCLLLYSHPYLSMALGVDHFDYMHHQDFKNYRRESHLPNGTLAIWDNWFAVTEGVIGLDSLMVHGFKVAKAFETQEGQRTVRIELLELSK